MERARFTQTLFGEMVSLYKTGTISDLCLALQHEYDADVPVFLICLMADRAELGLDALAFEDWIASAEAWRESVIRPLRQVRTTLKAQQVTGDANALRERIKSVELEAERLHVEALGAGFLAAGDGPSGGPSLAGKYLAAIGVPQGQIAPTLAAFAAQCATP